MPKENYDVIIIGAGPTGIFSAMELLNRRNDLKILILEKGTNLKKRICLFPTDNILKKYKLLNESMCQFIIDIIVK